MANPGPNTVNTPNFATTPKESGGYQIGQSPGDPIGFFGSTPVAQGTTGTDAIQQLIALGLLPAGSSVLSNGGNILANNALALTSANSGKAILLNSSTGSVVTLPAATGSGIKFRFYQTAAAPSSPHVVKVASNLDYMIGVIALQDANATTSFPAANSGTVGTNSDTISLSATTTGGLLAGAWLEVEDILANIWAVRGEGNASGTAATPFSAGV